MTGIDCYSDFVQDSVPQIKLTTPVDLNYHEIRDVMQYNYHEKSNKLNLECNGEDIFIEY